MTMNLFDSLSEVEPQQERLGPGAAVLRNFVPSRETSLLEALNEITARAPLRNMVTPGGFVMSVAMTNCGSLGWVSDRSGYRYDPFDPVSGQPWPELPDVFLTLAADAAAVAGFPGFTPDACLINQYRPGTKLSLHQDKDEKDFSQPIVSVSLGIPAVFLFGGFRRADKTIRIPLTHGDVVVWGGPDRLRYHGVLPLKEEHHPLLGPHRINLTFRRAR